MKTLRAWIRRLAGLLPGASREDDLADEIESHLIMHAEDNVRAGMTPDEARRRAVLRLGGIESTKMAYRDRGTVPVVEHLVQDVRFAMRQLARQPGFTATAVLVLSLGISAGTAIFGFVDAALIAPLPYPHADRLVHVTESIAMIPRANLSYLDYLDWKARNTSFQSLEAFRGTGYLLKTPRGADPVAAAQVSGGFFRVLGVRPILGRDFRPGEDLAGAPRNVILTYGAWHKRFGGAADIVGQRVTLSNDPYTVIGVLPQDFQFAPRGAAELWTTLDPTRPCEKRRSCHNMYGIARLKDGVSVQMALANMTAVARQLEREYPDSNRGQGASVVPLSEVIVGDIRPILLVLLGGAALLLVISCVNVTSLLLVRSESRRRELAVRSAVGASPARLVSQFVTEGFVLVAAGTIIGLAAGAWAMQVLLSLVPAEMMLRLPFVRDVGLNGRVIACAAAVAFGASVLFGLTPALRVSTSAVRDGMADGSRGSAGLTWHRLGARLVALELATATVLLVASGLLGKSLYQLLRVDLGFNADRIATLDIAQPNDDNDERTVAFAHRVLDRVRTLPGVESAGIASVGPVNFNGNTTWIRFPGRPYNGEHNEVNQREVSAEYFKTLQATLVRGRFFTAADDGTAPRVVIINETLARKYFPGQDPIGRQIGDTELSPDSLREVVGIVGDIREGALDSEIWPAVYYPFDQSPDTYFSLLTRMSQDAASTLPALSAAVRALDPGVGTLDETTMEARIHDSQSAYLRRSAAWLVGGFAGVAWLLGIVGLYGVIAYSVGQRTREIGVRMALGAPARAVRRLVTRQALVLAAVGITVGLAAAIGAASLMRTMLFGTPPWDVTTLAAVSAALALSALAASYVPARRAASVDPIEALRVE
jgi:predicted permease